MNNKFAFFVAYKTSTKNANTIPKVKKWQKN